jgi:hypothetical protein
MLGKAIFRQSMPDRATIQVFRNRSTTPILKAARARRPAQAQLRPPGS